MEKSRYTDSQIISVLKQAEAVYQCLICAASTV